MYCPQCGTDEQQPKQFCRACGADLRIVRSALNRSEEFSAAAISAREEIGHAFAVKIKEIDSPHDLKKIAEDALPQIEKFLESPEQKRLRLIRSGVMTSSVGLAAIIIGFAFSFLSYKEKEWLMFGIVSFVPFLVGLGIILNGLFFSAPRKRAENSLPDFTKMPTQFAPQSTVITNELLATDTTVPTSSITEHTTQKLPGRVQN